MNKFDKNRKFIPVNICILTISDTRNEENDKSGKILLKKIKTAKHKVYDKR